jgi:hypothetical protein
MLPCWNDFTVEINYESISEMREKPDILLRRLQYDSCLCRANLNERRKENIDERFNRILGHLLQHRFI